MVAMLEALVKNSIIYWCPLIIASMVGHEHVPSSGVLLSLEQEMEGNCRCEALLT